MTLRQFAAELSGRLRLAGVPSPEVDARLLLAHTLGLDAAGLWLAWERALTPGELDRLEALARRRERREPLQHLLGETEWGGVRLRLTPDALIPRPETEWLLGLALAALGGQPAPRVLDVGTGTGALALGLKAARPDAAVWASELSPAALALARENAALGGLEVTFALGDLLAGLSGPFDLIVSNPPYLPDADRHTAQPEVRHDPALALYGGPDGLEVARRLVKGVEGVLAPGGRLLIELDPRNVGVLGGEMRARGWQSSIHPDLTGRARFLEAWLSP